MARERGGFWIGFCAVFFYPFGWLSARPRFVGLEHIPRQGGAVIAANHISHVDPIYSALAVHIARRVPRFLAKDSLWRVPLLGRILRSTGQIPVVHWGSHDVLDGYRKRYRPLPRTTVTVRCGEPVDLSAYRGRTVDAAVLREVTDLIMGQVRDLLAEVREEPAPQEFYRRETA